MRKRFKDWVANRRGHLLRARKTLPGLRAVLTPRRTSSLERDAFLTGLEPVFPFELKSFTKHVRRVAVNEAKRMVKAKEINRFDHRNVDASVDATRARLQESLEPLMASVDAKKRELVFKPREREKLMGLIRTDYEDYAARMINRENLDVEGNLRQDLFDLLWGRAQKKINAEMKRLERLYPARKTRSSAP